MSSSGESGKGSDSETGASTSLIVCLLFSCTFVQQTLSMEINREDGSVPFLIYWQTGVPVFPISAEKCEKRETFSGIFAKI